MFLNSFFKSAFAIYIFSSLHHCSGQRDRRQSLALCGGDQTVYSTPLYITSMDCLFRAAGRSRRVAILHWPGSRRGGRCWTTPWCWESPAHADTTPAAAVPPLATAALGLTPAPRHSESLQTKKSLISRPHGNLGFA